MDISSNGTRAPISPRRHTGSIAAAVAVVAFAVGCYGAYRVVEKPQPMPILLRQAIEPAILGSDAAVHSSAELVLLRNDGTTPVQVIDAASSRAAAAPPLYIAPQLVPPGGEVNVYVPVPGKCFTRNELTFIQNPPPVRITVSAQVENGPIQFVPVEITGDLAAILTKCGLADHGG